MPELRYNVCDFDDFLPEEPEPQKGNRRGLTVGETIREGERNSTLYKLARGDKARGLSPTASLASQRVTNREKCDPPLPDAEVEQIVRNAFEQLDRPEFAAKGDQAAKDEAKKDPLSPLRGLANEPTPADLESALRSMVGLLAGADPLKRARVRSEALELLKSRGVHGGAALVDAAMGLLARDSTAAGENAIFLADPDPWPDPVDGATLLREIKCALQRFVVLTEEAFVACVLWVVFAHAHEAFDISPILALLSATKRCGKSTLLEATSALVPRALVASNVTSAVLFRAIEAYYPTLLLDEADSFLPENEQMRGILNSGWRRALAQTLRLVGDDHAAKTFSTWCPKVIAAIETQPGGALPPTLHDRAVTITMRRRRRDEYIERFRAAKLRDFKPLCRQAARWTADNLEHLKTLDSVVPDSLNDRAADNWRPLLAIADLAGGEWPKAARKAALVLSGGDLDTEEDGPGVMLLGDVMLLFRKHEADRLSSAELIDGLVKLEGRPWADWFRGKPITARGIAQLLKAFGIRPKVERHEDEKQARGYNKIDFKDPCTRYYGNLSVPSVPSEQNQVVSSDFLCVPDPSWYGYENDVTIEKQSDGTHGTDRIPDSGGKKEMLAQPELFEEDDPGLLATRLADAEEMRTPAWEEVEI